MIGKKVILLAAALMAFQLQAQTIVQSESYVEFEIDNMVVSSVDGTIKGMQGAVQFDPQNLSGSRFDVTVKPETIDTENHERDDHLRSEDFFHVDKYTTVRFVSTEIRKKGSDYVTVGNLTILGVTRKVEIPFSVDDEGDKLVFEGEIEVNRFDYGLAEEAYDGTMMVGKMAEVTIVCVVRK